jgi:hypothetical protein
MADENVKVAVRVRPFNSREKERGAKLIIEMENPKTIINDPSGEKDPKPFTFDYSYYSHDQYHESDGSEGPAGLMIADAGKEEIYHNQEYVFNDVGKGVLQNAYDGFNTSLFAYGQTGAGKSYSMVGYGVNKGIVPLTFDELFKKIHADPDENVVHRVVFSMLEIYMEQVSDLVSGVKKKGGLKVRQDPKKGRFFVQDLSATPVGSFEEIEAQMEKGTNNRTVAATQMNATSSRAHTVMTMVYEQIITNPAEKTKTTRTSEINLIDLAGSERAESTGATGDRLKEGAQINKSLSALGNVISALAAGKKAPFRDSVLTKLLQNSLGGNSKTIMIAALSPADINYDETLGTLRYADRAKQIKNKAAVNESATDKLIRELKEENARIKAMLEGGGLDMSQVGGTGEMSPEEIAKMKKKMEADIRAQLANNENQASRMDDGEYEAKLAQMRKEFEASNTSKNEQDEKKKSCPFLQNLNEDEALSGMVVHFIEAGVNTCGRKEKGAATVPSIVLSGLSIKPEHAVFESDGTSTVSCEATGPVLINGKAPEGKQTMNHKDRVQIGTNHLFVFINPKNQNSPDGTPEEDITWEFAQGELAEAKGFGASDDSNPRAGITNELREQIMELLPMVAEANAISDRLNKKRTFEIMILSGPAAGLPANEAKVMVKMINLETGNRWMLSRSNFIDRRFMMQAIMRSAEQGEYDEDDDDEEEEDGEKPDPWYHSPAFVILGCATCFLDSLTYNIEFDEKVNIVDYKGRNEGQLHFSVYPCTEQGAHLDEDDVNEEPENLMGQPMFLEMRAHSAQGVKKTNKMKVVYTDPYSKAEVETSEIDDEDALEWDHMHMVKIPAVDRPILDWLKSGSLSCFVKVWQSDDDWVPGTLARQSTTLSIGGRKKSMGGGGGEALAHINQVLRVIVKEFKEGERDGKNVVAAVTALLDGKPPVPPAKDLNGPTVAELENKLQSAEEQIRSLRRKGTLAVLMSAKGRKASNAADQATKEQLAELQKAVASQQGGQQKQKSGACIVM